MSRTYNILLFTLLLASLPFFFFKLGQTSLSSWDEAWYADISRNTLISHNPFILMFNGSQYVDHPPIGFWLTATSQLLLGVSNFSARVASAISGLLCLVVVYQLGKTMFHPSVGLASSLALLSSPWFLSRARSGNLDIYLTLFFLLTFYFAFVKRFVPLLINLTLALLTKSVVPFTLIPTVIFLLWPLKLTSQRITQVILLTLLPILLWATIAQLTFPGNYLAKYFQIGLPHVSVATNFVANLTLTKTYLHNGIGDWFRPAMALATISLFLRQKRHYNLLLLIGCFLLPFLFSGSGQIWHLIPIHPFLLLSLFGTLYSLIRSPAIVLTFCLLIAIPQLHRNWVTFIDIPAFVSDEAILASKAQPFPGTLIIDEDYIPAAVYYSHKHVEFESVPSLQTLFARPSLLLITHNWRLSRDGIDPNLYTVIATDRDKVLLIKN